MTKASWGLFIMLVCSAPVAIAQGAQTQNQDQHDSLAAAARRARDAKKSQAAPKKVWTNEDIPKTGDDISIIGPEAPAQDAGKQATGADSKDAGKPASGKASPEEEKKAQDDIKAQLDAAKDELQTEQSDFDIMQRKLALDKQTYYGKTDYSSDTQGATDLKNEQDQIDSKQGEISDTQKKIADLQAKVPQDSSATTDTNPTQQ